MVAVLHVPAFEDNYIWLVRGSSARHVAVVDPGDASPVLAYCTEHRLTPCAILCTHYHYDHVGGIEDLVKHHAIPVYGPAAERIPCITRRVQDGDVVSVPELALAFQVISVPGHTKGHVAYYGHGMLFCGDTLFSAGCGRLFEGTAEQMHASLAKLAALPDDTLVYCGHEYTLANIGFAKSVEPGNEALATREHADAAARAEGRPTLPSTIGREKATNPFLRASEPAVIAAANKYLGARAASPVAVFAALRDWKNRA
jgi:hydroxyacylglutathione hydrolase